MGQVCIYQVTHKQVCKPDVSFLIPIQAGAGFSAEKIAVLRDDAGDNISDKNRSFCELTVLYWIWKNSSYKIVGLCHYRRQFRFQNSAKIESLLNKFDIIVPKAYYFKETLFDEYSKSHIGNDLTILLQIIKEERPEYFTTAVSVLEKNKLYPYNMFIMKKDLLDQYCNWLFPVLFKMEQEIKEEERTAYQNRYIGFLAERLMTVYIIHNQLKAYQSSLKYSERCYRLKEAMAGLKNRIQFFIQNSGGKGKEKR